MYFGAPSRQRQVCVISIKRLQSNSSFFYIKQKTNKEINFSKFHAHFKIRANYHLLYPTSLISALHFIAGHSMYKRVTDSSLLGGSCIVSSFVPLQMICEVNGKIQMLHQNVSHSNSKQVRPIRIWAVPEDTGQLFFRLCSL